MHVALENVTKRFGGVRALDGVSFSIEPGQIVAVLGPNGAGKSTLLRCLSGLSAPNKGEVLYDDERFRRSRIDLRRRLAFLADLPCFLSGDTALRHIAMVLRLYGADEPGVEERVLDLLRELDLLPVAEVPVGYLSRGQAYKAALAALLTLDRELWLLDEPFASGMDPQGISVFKRRAREAAARGHTVIYSTQILDVAERFCDSFCLLHEGRLYASDSVAQLRDMATEGGGVLETLFARLREDEP